MRIKSMNARKTSLTVLCAVAAIVGSMAATATEPAQTDPMDSYLWTHRPLVVFAPSASHPILFAQRRALVTEMDGLADREIVLIEVAGDGVAVNGHPVPNMDADGLRVRYGMPSDAATTVLVGKDGGVKMRRNGALSAETLFSTIDAMPMRRTEMQERGQ